MTDYIKTKANIWSDSWRFKLSHALYVTFPSASKVGQRTLWFRGLFSDNLALEIFLKGCSRSSRVWDTGWFHIVAKFKAETSHLVVVCFRVQIGTFRWNHKCLTKRHKDKANTWLDSGKYPKHCCVLGWTGLLDVCTASDKNIRKNEDVLNRRFPLVRTYHSNRAYFNQTDLTSVKTSSFL